MDILRLSEGVASLQLPVQFIEKCVDEAKRKQRHDTLCDMHYFHFTRRNKANCICIVLHHPRVGIPEIDVLLEAEAAHMSTVIKRVRGEATSGQSP